MVIFWDVFWDVFWDATHRESAVLIFLSVNPHPSSSAVALLLLKTNCPGARVIVCPLTVEMVSVVTAWTRHHRKNLRVVGSSISDRMLNGIVSLPIAPDLLRINAVLNEGMRALRGRKHD